MLVATSLMARPLRVGGALAGDHPAGQVPQKVW
jgi:hypothetical protein